eukprot:UN05999
MLKTRQDLETVTDHELKKLFSFTDINIKQWRQNLPYKQNTWQRTLYDIDYGKFACTFEEKNIKNLGGIKDTELKDLFELSNVNIAEWRKSLPYAKDAP